MCNRNILLANMFVVIQLTILGYFILTGGWIAGSIPLNLIIASGLVMGFWAIWVVNPKRVNIRPLPHPQGKLVSSGPYRFIRHPMYGAQLLVTLAWVIDGRREIDWLIWFIYLLLLLLKLRFEEIQLNAQFSGYAEYQKKTRRLIPFVW